MTDIPQYTVYLKPAAERALKKIADQTARRRIVRAIDGLATTARPPQAVKIQGSDGLLRIRTGDYRIIAAIGLTRLPLAMQLGYATTTQTSENRSGRNVVEGCRQEGARRRCQAATLQGYRGSDS